MRTDGVTSPRIHGSADSPARPARSSGMDFYTLHALAREWGALLTGATVADAWTQSPREATLALGDAGALRVVCDPGLPLLFRATGAARQRRNTADVLPGVVGQRIRGVRTADRDRHVFLDLDEGRVQVVLFGARPNAFWVDDSGTVRQAFLDEDEWVGQPAPRPRPAPVVNASDAFVARWRDRKTLAQAVAGAVPLFTRDLAAQAVRRAGLDPDASPESLPRTRSGGADRDGLFEAVRAFERDLEAPRPHVYWRGPLAETFALVPLADPPETWRAEPFETVDAALSVWARRSLGQRAYAEAYVPLERALASAVARRTRSADAMLDELSQPSRAGRYETWAHLLMASGNAPAGRESVTLPDIVSGTEAAVEIPLDPARTARRERRALLRQGSADAPRARDRRGTVGGCPRRGRGRRRSAGAGPRHDGAGRAPRDPGPRGGCPRGASRPEGHVGSGRVLPPGRAAGRLGGARRQARARQRAPDHARGLAARPLAPRARRARLARRRPPTWSLGRGSARGRRGGGAAGGVVLDRPHPVRGAGDRHRAEVRPPCQGRPSGARPRGPRGRAGRGTDGAVIGKPPGPAA